MAAARRSGLSGLLLLGLLAAAALVWFLVHEEGSDPERDDPFTEAGPARAEGARPAAVGPDSGQAPLRRRSNPWSHAQRTGLPRVLPADAAVEDVRDALARSPEERGDALELARDAMLRLASEGEPIVRGLRTYADAVEDEVVRGIVLASLGTLRTEAHRHWLCEQLENAPTTAERMGALIALAQPRDPRLSKRKGSPGWAEAPLLGGLAYYYDAFPPSPAAIKAVAHWLRRGKAAEARAGLPIVLRCVRAYDTWAALLVGEDGRMQPWFSLLSVPDRAHVKSAALAHGKLKAQARAVITSAE